VKVVVASLAAALVLLVAFTWWALESSGVAILETRAADGSLRSTHVWFAEPDGELWVEAGAPDNAWYRDVQRDPRVSFTASGRSGRYLAERIDEPGARPDPVPAPEEVRPARLVGHPALRHVAIRRRAARAVARAGRVMGARQRAVAAEPRMGLPEMQSQ
jgi:hypothetical protein